MAVDRVYRAIGLDDRKNPLSADWGALVDLARALRGLEKPVDISAVMGAVERLLDESIDASAYVIQEPPKTPWGGRIHLGQIDFEALARFFARSKQKAATAEAMTVAVRRRVESMVRLNPTRASLREQLERLIADYNEGAHSTDGFFEELLAFAKKLEAEESRAQGEGLDQEQLAIYDLVLTAGVALSPEDREQAKKIAGELPGKIERKLVIDWRKTPRARAGVKAAIKDALDALPNAFERESYDKLVEAVYEHVYESYWGEGKSKYTDARA
jgi:type I restriction enzyme, R subunit